ncbi:Zinc finger, CCHC-type [Sesbania bispinosa]|nr:Zinc finger, CCHC-type [Sesbania bispinosa]
MPPRTRIPARREASGESASQSRDPLQRGRGRGCSRGRRDVNTGATMGGIEVTLAEFMKLKPPTFSGSNANEDPQRFIDGLERLWRALSCSDIRAVELASFQLEGVAYDWFDTVTRGRSVGSPPLAWGEFSRLFMARFLPESVRDGLAHEFERLEQTEAQSRRSDQGRSSRTSFPQRHFGVTSIPCPTCGRLHTGACFGDGRVCYQCVQAGHIRRDCPAAVTQPSSNHASAPTTLASSQAPSAPVRLFGGSSGRAYGVAQQSGRGSGGRGQAQAGRGQARVFAMTRQDDHASNAVVTCPSSLDETLAVTTPVGEILLVDCVYRSCVVSIEGKELFANLIALDMVDFDVILGMDWLASHYATLDCHNKVMKFEMLGESGFSFQGEQGWAPHNLISALAASKLLRKGC